MELNDAVKTLVESMRSINAKIGNSYLSLEFVLFERDDFKISTYAGKYGNTFYDKYNLSKEDVNVTEDSLIDGLKQGVNSRKERLQSEIQEHEEAIDKLKSEIKELDATMEETKDDQGLMALKWF